MTTDPILYQEADAPEIALVLATYNEAANLPTLVKALESLGEDLHLLVVDDSSPDGTLQVAQQLADTYGNITILSRPRKLGLGSALRDGLQTVLATQAAYIMTMDADYSHDPRDVPRLLTEMRREEADMVQGSRYIKGGGVRGWGPVRWLLSWTSNKLYHWCDNAPHECTTNFRVFSRAAAAVVVAKARGVDYEFVPEATLLTLAAGMRIREVPIIFTDRALGSSKLGKRQAVKAVLFFVTATVQYRLRIGRFRRHWPASDRVVELSEKHRGGQQ